MLAQGAKSTRAAERRCKRRIAGGRAATRRRSRADEISQSQAQKAPDSESGRSLSEAGRADGITHYRRAKVCVAIIYARVRLLEVTWEAAPSRLTSSRRMSHRDIFVRVPEAFSAARRPSLRSRRAPLFRQDA